MEARAKVEAMRTSAPSSASAVGAKNEEKNSANSPPGLVHAAHVTAPHGRGRRAGEERGWIAEDAAYGDVALIGTAPEDVPASGGPTYFGLFKCLEIVPASTDWPAIGGDTWISLIRFGGQGRAASSILLPGPATEPGAPAHRSQAPHFDEKTLVPHQPLA